MEILAAVIFLLAFLVGLAGVILPILPGVPLIAVGALVYAWMTGFERLGTYGLVVIAFLTVLSQVTEYLTAIMGAKQYGASRAGIWGSIIGSLIGLFILPPFGFLLGALLGAVVAELIVGRNLEEAIRSGVGALLGTLGGVVIKIIIVIAIGIIVFPAMF